MANTPPDLTRLDGKVVLVTGAARGIGRAVAVAAARSGATVFAIDYRDDELGGTLAELGPRHAGERFDLREIGSIGALCDRVGSRFGAIDAVAHVAALILRRSDLDSVTEEDFDDQCTVNLKATFFLDREAARVMRAAGSRGSIVNFSSQGWWTGGYGGSVVYSATKGGVVSLTRGLARMLAPSGIRVNAVAPGAVDTAMMSDGVSDAARAEFVDQIPLGRMASPEEIAATVVFLMSDASSYITGTTLNVSGGQLAY